MRTITATEYNQHASARLREVEHTREPLAITRRGRVVAHLVPADGDDWNLVERIRSRAERRADDPDHEWFDLPARGPAREVDLW